jgi:hypothetical protein
MPGNLIVGNILERTGTLHKLVADATYGILVEVKTLLYEQKIRYIPRRLTNVAYWCNCNRLIERIRVSSSDVVEV